MSRILEELTSGSQCWSTDVLSHVRRAIAEIERLRQREASTHVHPRAATPADLANFESWLDKQDHRGPGSYKRAVVVRDVGGAGHGLVATKAIHRDESFIAVPYEAILSADSALGPPTPETDVTAWAPAQQDPLLRSFPSCLLAVRLLVEANRATASPFAPYIAVLPVNFDIPLFYSIIDFEALEPTTLFAPAVKLLYNAIKQFLYLQRLVQSPRWPSCPLPKEALTLTNYFWALGAVLTRQNEVAVMDNGVTRAALALIPGWDMSNHELSESITAFADPRQKIISCRAIRDFAADEEVTMFYGPRGNEHFLLYSGFVPNGSNPHDLVTVTVPIETSDPLFKIRKMILQKEFNLDPSLDALETNGGIRVEFNRDGSLTSVEAFRAVQVAFMSKTNLSSALRASAEIAVAGSGACYTWSSEEIATAKACFSQACERALAEVEAWPPARFDAAPHGSLFTKFFDAQKEVLRSAAISERAICHQ